MKNTRRIVAAGLSMLVVVGTMLFAVYAWFALSYEGELPFSFLPGSLKDEIVLGMSTVPPAGNGAAEAPESSRTAFVDCAAGLDRFGLGSRVEADAGRYSLKVENMSFGTVDNLVRHKPENIIYFRLTIPKKAGNAVNFKLSYLMGEDGNFVDLYQKIKVTDADGNSTWATDDSGHILWETVPPQMEADFVSVQDDVELTDENGNTTVVSRGECYLTYAYAFSATDIPTTTLAAEEEAGSLVFSESIDFNAFDDVAEDAQDCVSVDCPADIYDATAADGVYYLYIKVTPNLLAFGLSVDHIVTIMPCFLYFGVRADFEIYVRDAVLEPAGIGITETEVTAP